MVLLFDCRLIDKSEGERERGGRGVFMRWVKWDDGPLQYNTSASVSGGLVIRARNQVMQLRTENCLIELNWIGLDWIGLAIP